MQMQIRSLNLDASAAVEQHAEERLVAALSHFVDRTSGVDVRLEDLHGQRHGQEMRCTIRVHVNGAGVVMVEQVDSDLYRAIDQASHRVKRVVHQRVGRSREFDHTRHIDQMRAA